MLENNRRSCLFDNIKAALIFCVVFAHFLRAGGQFEPQSAVMTIYVVCFSFMMQGFFFISGFFSKNEEKCRASSFEKLLLPYILFTIVYVVENIMLKGSPDFNPLIPVFGFWFLLVMFYYRFGLKTLIRIPHVFALSIAASIIVSIIPAPWSGLAAGRAVSFLVFFLAGYFFRWEHVEAIRKIPKAAGVCTIIAMIIAAFAFTEAGHYSEKILFLKDDCFRYGVSLQEGLLLRAVIIAVSFLWIMALINLVPDRRLGRKGLITQIGQNTMTVYLLHVFVRNALMTEGRKIEFLSQCEEPVYIITILAFAVLCVYMFSRPVVAKGYDMLMRTAHNSFQSLFQQTRGSKR